MDRTCILNESQISTADGCTECDTGNWNHKIKCVVCEFNASSSSSSI